MGGCAFAVVPESSPYLENGRACVKSVNAKSVARACMQWTVRQAISSRRRSMWIRGILALLICRGPLWDT